jgi:hypothetical protein
MDYACLFFVYSDWFLPQPKLFNGLPIAMVLLPCIEDGDATKVQSSSFYTPKITIPTINDHEFQTHEQIVCKANFFCRMYEIIKERKRGRGKIDYLRKL